MSLVRVGAAAPQVIDVWSHSLPLSPSGLRGKHTKSRDRRHTRTNPTCFPELDDDLPLLLDSLAEEEEFCVRWAVVCRMTETITIPANLFDEAVDFGL